MIQHWTSGKWDAGLGQLKSDFTGLGDTSRIRTDARRAMMARYFVLAVGVAMLLWLLAHALGFGGAVGLIHAIRVITVAVLGPTLVWIASDREIRLLHELEKRGKQLKQRVQEITALNRMTQDHLAECFTFSGQQTVVEADRWSAANGEHANQEYVGAVAD